MTVLVPIAFGTEEAEAVVTIDILRRANLEVLVAGLTSPVVCSRKVQIVPDTTADRIAEDTLFDAVVLPGGAEGTKQLMHSAWLRQLLQHHHQQQRWIAAICAAPLILHVTHILQPGQMVTGHPTIKEHLVERYVYLNQPVVVDGKIITSQGMGTAVDFALSIVSQLQSPALAQEIADRICYQWDSRR